MRSAGAIDTHMEYIKGAWKNITMNKGRTVLTMLGIIIGISSVIAILSVGNGLKSDLTSSLDDMVSGAVTINLDPKKTDKYLTATDLKVIEDAIPIARGVSPNFSAFGESKYRRTMNTRVLGGTPGCVYEFEANGSHMSVTSKSSPLPSLTNGSGFFGVTVSE